MPEEDKKSSKSEYDLLVLSMRVESEEAES